MEITDRHVVVTGAASGIGKALATRFAAEGARAVVVADLDGDKARTVADDIDGLGVQVDVGSEDSIKALIATATDANGPIDVFVSNAGVPGGLGGPEIPNEMWDHTWRVNVMAHVWAARTLIPEMVERGEGYLVSTASAAGVLTQVSSVTYSVTKHAAVAFAEWLSIEYGDAGIRVSCICPQGVRTPMLEMAMDDHIGAVALQAGGDLIAPEDVADAVVAGMRDERFLILPHEEVAQYMAFKAGANDKWLAAMRGLVRSARETTAG